MQGTEFIPPSQESENFDAFNRLLNKGHKCYGLASFPEKEQLLALYHLLGYDKTRGSLSLEEDLDYRYFCNNTSSMTYWPEEDKRYYYFLEGKKDGTGKTKYLPPLERDELHKEITKTMERRKYAEDPLHPIYYCSDLLIKRYSLVEKGKDDLTYKLSTARTYLRNTEIDLKQFEEEYEELRIDYNKQFPDHEKNGRPSSHQNELLKRTLKIEAQIGFRNFLINRIKELEAEPAVKATLPKPEEGSQSINVKPSLDDNTGIEEDSIFPRETLIRVYMAFKNDNIWENINLENFLNSFDQNKAPTGFKVLKNKQPFYSILLVLWKHSIENYGSINGSRKDRLVPFFERYQLDYGTFTNVEKRFIRKELKKNRPFLEKLGKLLPTND